MIGRVLLLLALCTPAFGEITKIPCADRIAFMTYANRLFRGMWKDLPKDEAFLAAANKDLGEALGPIFHWTRPRTLLRTLFAYVEQATEIMVVPTDTTYQVFYPAETEGTGFRTVFPRTPEVEARFNHFFVSQVLPHYRDPEIARARLLLAENGGRLSWKDYLHLLGNGVKRFFLIDLPLEGGTKTVSISVQPFEGGSKVYVMARIESLAKATDLYSDLAHAVDGEGGPAVFTKSPPFETGGRMERDDYDLGVFSGHTIEADLFSLLGVSEADQEKICPGLPADQGGEVIQFRPKGNTTFRYDDRTSTEAFALKQMIEKLLLHSN